jgi:hypothetical protein
MRSGGEDLGGDALKYPRHNRVSPRPALGANASHWAIRVRPELRQCLIGTQIATDKIQAGAPQCINQILRTDAGQVQLRKAR